RVDPGPTFDEVVTVTTTEAVVPSVTAQRVVSAPRLKVVREQARVPELEQLEYEQVEYEQVNPEQVEYEE
ncbi:MAG TPA: hypothetical protein VHJ82_01705, partial [Actinomycetota bacterium]|nr:hypothetical protein [Actinomycetota bacterium]